MTNCVFNTYYLSIDGNHIFCESGLSLPLSVCLNLNFYVKCHLFDDDEANGLSDQAKSIRNGNGPSNQSLTW